MTTPTMVIIAMPKNKAMVKIWDLSKTKMVCCKTDGIRTTMPAKIKREMPLPMCFSEINSPSHMTKIVPAVTVETIIKSRQGERSEKIWPEDLFNKAIKA